MREPASNNKTKPLVLISDTFCEIGNDVTVTVLQNKKKRSKIAIFHSSSTLILLWETVQNQNDAEIYGTGATSCASVSVQISLWCLFVCDLIMASWCQQLTAPLTTCHNNVFRSTWTGTNPGTEGEPRGNREGTERELRGTEREPRGN